MSSRSRTHQTVSPLLNLRCLSVTARQVDRSVLAKCLLQICHLVRDILIQEPRLLQLKSPCYILGTRTGGGVGTLMGRGAAQD